MDNHGDSIAIVFAVCFAFLELLLLFIDVPVLVVLLLLQ